MTSQQNIVLIGFMGTGKTTVGLLLAKEMGWEFIDSDQEIERSSGKQIQDIFREQGESAFRKIERETIASLCTQHTNKIISLGGGAYTQEAVREVCLRTSTVVYLSLSWEAWKKRREMLIEGRPLLQTKSIDEVQALYESRLPLYAQHHIKVETDALSPEQVTQSIIAQIANGKPKTCD